MLPLANRIRSKPEIYEQNQSSQDHNKTQQSTNHVLNPKDVDAEFAVLWSHEVYVSYHILISTLASMISIALGLFKKDRSFLNKPSAIIITWDAFWTIFIADGLL